MTFGTTEILDKESEHLFLCYCTLTMNLQGKKMSLQNVFVHTLKSERMRNVLKDLLCLDTDQEAVKVFLDFDPTIAKSKYVTKYLNSRSKK